MTEYTGSKTTIHVRCAVVWKERVAAFAKAQGKTVSDVIIDEVSEAMKFHDFEKTTSEAQSDWETLAELTREGKQIPEEGR